MARTSQKENHRFDFCLTRHEIESQPTAQEEWDSILGRVKPKAKLCSGFLT